MKAEYINSFYNATKNVFNMMLGVDINRGKIALGREKIEEKYIGILVTITGRLKGCVYYIFPNEVALKMVEHMAGIELENIDTFVSATLVEIVTKVNILAQNSLVDQRKKCKLSEPQVHIDNVHENNINKVFEDYEGFICVPIESEIGNFDMNIVIK